MSKVANLLAVHVVVRLRCPGVDRVVEEKRWHDVGNVLRDSPERIARSLQRE